MEDTSADKTEIQNSDLTDDNTPKNETPLQNSKYYDELPFKTCPMDPRFPHTNQTYHCFISFVDFQRCSRLLGNYDGCKILEKYYKTLCPNFWIEKWEEQIDKGTFPVNLPDWKKAEDPEEELALENGSEEELKTPIDAEEEPSMTNNSEEPNMTNNSEEEANGNK